MKSTLLALVFASTVVSAADLPQTIYVVIPPLKTDEAKAATEIKRLLGRKQKEVSIVDAADTAAYTVEVTTVEKRSVGKTLSPFVAGQADDVRAVFVTAKLCVPAKDFCATIEGDSAQQVIPLGALDWAALRVEEKIRKAIR